MTPVRIEIAFLALIGALVTAGAGPNLSAARAGPGSASSLAPEYGEYSWPIHGPVIRGFEPPPDPYGSGHRGIDIGAPFGSDIAAPRDGVVAFAGWVGGALFVSIDHPDGVRTTYSWLSQLRVSKGQSVARGELIAQSGHGHPEVPEPHLHFGARIGSVYIDPMLLLEGAEVSDLIHLAPLEIEPMAGWLDSVGRVRFPNPSAHAGVWPWRPSHLSPPPRMGGLDLTRFDPG